MTDKKLDIGEETPKQEPKIDISIVNYEVVVTISDDLTMDEAAHIFFDSMALYFPHWLKDAGYIKEVKLDDPYIIHD